MGQDGMTRGDWLGALPAPCAREIRTASVEPYLAELFAHLPQPLELDADVPPEPEALPRAARQLLKLALSGTQLRPRRIRQAETLELTISAGDRQRALRWEHLAQDIDVVARQILEGLCQSGDFVRTLEAFAIESANRATLQHIISHMLETTDVDHALHAMLSGITSGRGLGFNRAALFTYDEACRLYGGAKAIGPGDAREASRIWEELEFADLTIDGIVANYEPTRFDTPFQRFVQQLELVPGGPDDEVTRAVAPDAPLLFQGAPRNPALRRLTDADEFVLAAVRPHGQILGLIFADNRYSRAPITPGRLHYFDFFVDQTAMVWENLLLLKRVETLARVDSLTGVLNRREFETRFEAERSRSLRSQGPCSLLLLDVDRFKQVNDREGHAAGDEVLRRLGALLQQAVRAHDVLARFGGDEFIVLLPDTPSEHLAQAAARIGSLARHADISVSVGGATWPSDCDDLGQLFAVADRNLYRAKDAGRGRACFGAAEPLVIARAW
jgi:diguanylate cyclase (GGDEF)-like protein